MTGIPRYLYVLRSHDGRSLEFEQSRWSYRRHLGQDILRTPALDDEGIGERRPCAPGTSTAAEGRSGLNTSRRPFPDEVSNSSHQIYRHPRAGIGGETNPF